MPIQNYGVLKGKVVGKDRGKPGDSTPHFEIHMQAAGKHYRIAVNVQSKEAPSQVLYFANEAFEWDRLQQLKGLAAGFKALGKGSSLAIDYVRSGLLDPTKMKPLPPDVPGQNNDLEDLIEKYVTLAMTKPGATVYAFGSRFGPQKGKDKTFGFSPQLGVHDVHMNQGNSSSFMRDDGVFQDGALLFYLPQGDMWTAVFLAFQSQSFHTDDRTGHRLAAAAAVAGSPGAAAVVAPHAHKRRRR